MSRQLVAAKGGAPTPFVNAFDTVAVGSLRYNTSQAGSPLPICYGTQRISINLLEFWGYSGGPSKGGKGGGGGGKTNTKKQANYSVYTAVGICQGPVSFTGSIYGSGGNNRVWANSGIAYGPGSVDLNAFSGADGQPPDPVFVSQDPNTPVLGYSGTCYCTGDPLQLGQSPALPNISFEITGFEVGTVGTGFPDDANPSVIISDMLSNSRYGAGFPSANIDLAGTFAVLSTYCQATQLAMSLLLDRCQSAAQWIEYICGLIVAAPFWSGATLKIVPYALTPYSANGATWTPNLTIQYSLGDRDFIDWGGDSDPVIVTRSDPMQASNWFGVEYYDASNAYNPNIAYAFDQGAIDSFGLRNEPVAEAHAITNLTSAQISAQFQLQRKQLIRNTYKFQAGWVFALLDPMDIIEITDIAAGLNQIPVRITGIEENENNELTFTAEELPGIASGIPVYEMVVPSSVTPNVNALPGNSNPPIVFEPFAPLSGNTLEVWILSSGGSDWGGANVWISTDGTTYALAGSVAAGARQGVTDSVLAPNDLYTANPQTLNLEVDLTESAGELNSASSSDDINAVSLCVVQDVGARTFELLSYETATLTAANKYTLNPGCRGLFGTTNLDGDTTASHGIGSAFAYIGLQTGNIPGVLKYNYASNLVGTTISIKLQSFNNFSGQLQDLAALTPYTYTLTGNGTARLITAPQHSPGSSVANETLYIACAPFPCSLPLNGATSVAFCGTAPSANVTINIIKYSYQGTPGTIGTITFASGSNTGVFSLTATSFVTGDNIVAQIGTPHGIADVSIQLNFTTP